MPITKKTIKTSKAKLSRVKSGLTLSLLGVDGKEKSTTPLPKEIFSVKVSPKLLATYVRVYLINQRQGTASAKTRGQVTGSTRKIYKQKGTGRARHGDIKAPIFVGGGVVGGPIPKKYSSSLNKKQKRTALMGALTLKLTQGDVVGLSNNFLKMKAKTKEFTGFLKNTGLNDKTALVVLPKLEKNNLVLASRNIPQITLADAKSLNAYEVLKNKKLLLIEDAVSVLQKHFFSKKDEN